MGRLIVSWVPRPPAHLKGRCGAPPRWASAGPSARSARLAHRAPHPRSALAALACPLTRAPGVEGALMRAMEGHRSPIAPSTGERSRCRPSQDLVHAHAICAYRPTDGAGDPEKPLHPQGGIALGLAGPRACRDARRAPSNQPANAGSSTPTGARSPLLTLQAYLKEFSFRFNRPNFRTRDPIVRRLLEQVVVTGLVTGAEVADGYLRSDDPMM